MDKASEIRAQRVVLVKHPSEVELNVTGALSKADLTADIYHPILNALADHQPRSLGEIEVIVKANGISLGQLLQSIFILMGKSAIQPARSETAIVASQENYNLLNANIIERAKSYDTIGVLASPVTGGGIPLERFKQLSLLAYQQGITQPSEIAKFVWQIMQYQGNKISKEGTLLQTDEENLTELANVAKELMELSIPMLKALKIISA